MGADVIKPTQHETTALGAARLAGLTVGLWKDARALANAQAVDRKYTPQMSKEERADKLAKWHKAVERSLGWEQP